MVENFVSINVFCSKNMQLTGQTQCYHYKFPTLPVNSNKVFCWLGVCLNCNSPENTNNAFIRLHGKDTESLITLSEQRMFFLLGIEVRFDIEIFRHLVLPMLWNVNSSEPRDLLCKNQVFYWVLFVWQLKPQRNHPALVAKTFCRRKLTEAKGFG